MKRLTEEELIKNVTDKCKIKNYTLLGIDEFKGVETKLKLRCEKDLNYWNSTSYQHFMNDGSGCSACSRHLKLTEEKLIENVKKECLVRNYEFIEIFGEFNGSKTKLKLQCKKDLTCWSSTSYHHFFTNGSGCPTCARLKTLKGVIITEDKLIENIKLECERRGGNIEFLGLVKFINVSKTYLKLKCLIDNFEWKVKYSNFIKGSNCPKCKPAKNSPDYRLSEEQMIKNVQKECKERGNVEFISLVEYKTADTTYLKLKCLTDGNIWMTTTYNSFLSKQKPKCPKCARSKFKITEVQMIENIQKKCEKRNYTFLGLEEYKNCRSKLKLRCNKDGYVWDIHYNQFLNKNTGCPKCSGTLKTTELEANEKINNICIRKNYILLEPFVYINRNSRIKLKCVKDNYEWETSYVVLVNGDSNCPKCSGRFMISEEELIENVKLECEIRKNIKFLDILKFNGVQTHLKLECLIDGNIWTSCSYFSFVKLGTGCSKCRTSRLEAKIEMLLKENNINFIPQYKFKELYRQSLDFFLPDYDIAIEAQGGQHFKSVEFYGGEAGYKKTLERDERKHNICKEKGIRILYYTECEQEIIPINYYDKIFTNTSDLLVEIFENNQ